MKKRRQLVIATAAAVVVLAGGGYLGMASYRSATAPVATSEQKEFLTVNKTSMALKNGKADLVINVEAHTAVKVTADGNVMDPVEWPATDSSQSYMLALTSNGTYYVEATNGGKTKKIKVVVGDGKPAEKKSSAKSSSSESTSEATSESVEPVVESSETVADTEASVATTPSYTAPSTGGNYYVPSTPSTGGGTGNEEVDNGGSDYDQEDQPSGNNGGSEDSGQAEAPSSGDDSIEIGHQ
ncbi:hypothetical protein [Weissella confusa]|uniref:hypothetical protein n=1 Tax=Weissella confusa TaxID=1583 RepID=UPI0013DFD645|nr:hypothetical protein [Weissella confusa]QIE79028.1 hypothetical protein G4V46_07250 [Weissella confusa]